MGDRRRRHVHHPTTRLDRARGHDVRRSVDVDRPVVLPGPEHTDLRGDVHDGVAAGGRLDDGRGVRGCHRDAARRRRPRAQSECVGGTRRRRRELPSAFGHAGADQAGAPGDQDPHCRHASFGRVGRPARRRPSRPPRHDRSWRCGGCRPGATAPSAPRQPHGRQPSAPRRRPRRLPGRRHTPGVLEHDHELLASGRAHSHGSTAWHPERSLDRPFDRDRRDRAIDAVDHVDRPTLDPESAVGVDVTDVARAMPRRPRPGRAARCVAHSP